MVKRKKDTEERKENSLPVVFGYKKEFCSSLIRLMNEGFSFESWCADNDIHPRTAKEWVLEKPEFRAAYELGMAKAQYFHERKMLGLLNSYGKNVEGVKFKVSSFILKSKYRWSEKDIQVVDDLTDDEILDKVIDMALEKGRYVHKKKRT